MALTGRDLEMALSPPPGCLVWPIDAWPEIDQHLWWAGLDPGDGLDPTYAADLAQSTITNARKGYGRWLAVLAAAGELDPAVPPATRVSRARAKLFAKALRARANANHSIHARFWELRSALRILQPDEDFAWLTGWLGRLPITLREVEAFDSRILTAWGHQLMQSALAHPQPMVRQIRYRNGLMIAIMAARAPRLRALAAMRLGRQVTQGADGGWQLSFKTQDVKTERLVEYDVPDSLVANIDRYMAVERKELLQGRQHDWFWVNRNGEKLGARGIEGVIRRGSEAQFGRVFGPHRFRHSLATTAAYADPSNPGLAASVLAISEEVNAAHYNQARKDDAMHRFQAHIQKERARTARLVT
jgi:hypothetical protein